MSLTPEQARCVETLDRPIVVAAGAGSGKTYTLKERIAHAFECGAIDDIGQLCAITFTTKAAAELKSRIKAELKARGRIEQSLKVDDAWISTIHGMCSRILKAHALELGIDPAFSILDPADERDYIATAVDQVLESARSRHSDRLDALFGEYRARSGGYDTSVESMLLTLVNAAGESKDGIGSFVLPGSTLPPMLAVERTIEAMEALMALAEETKESASRNTWIAEQSLCIESAREAFGKGIGDPLKALEIIGAFKVSKKFGTAAFKEQVAETSLLLASCAMEMRLAIAQPHLETLVELAAETIDLFTQMKREAGLLDNSDLIIMAARAIEEHPAIAQCYVDKFRLVMVDEFQDTDQLQVDMIRRISGPDACRLCTVGDAQQSIYGFRGADVKVYERHLEQVEAADERNVIKLTKNFRSHCDVLAFVDRVFEQGAMFGKRFMTLDAERDEPAEPAFAPGAPRVVVQHTVAPSRLPKSANVAQRIAEQFARWRDEGHSAGEMVILLRSMTHAGEYAQALRDHDFSCVIAGGTVFAQTPEAQIALSLVQFIANPAQTQALVNVLVSPLFALSAGDLEDARGDASPRRMLERFGLATSDDAGERAIAASPELVCAQTVVGNIRAAAGHEPVWSIVQRTLLESGWLARLDEQGPEGQASAANAHKAVRLIRAIEESQALGPASVAQRFESLLENAKEAPGALSVTGSDSVRIMTYHASKGLEFPIVAVAEMPEDKSVSDKLLCNSIDGKTYLSLDAGATAQTHALDGSAWNALCQEAFSGVGKDPDERVKQDEGALYRRMALKCSIEQSEQEESKRLLYVAITRAREAVLVACTGKRTKSGPSGMPNSVMASVLSGLLPAGCAPETGTTLCEFGGESKAVLDVVEVARADETAQDEPEEESRETAPREDAMFAVPTKWERGCRFYAPFKPLHDGVFSYSSISDASHDGTTLPDLATHYAVAEISDGESPMNLVGGRLGAMPPGSPEEDSPAAARRQEPHQPACPPPPAQAAHPLRGTGALCSEPIAYQDPEANPAHGYDGVFNTDDPWSFAAFETGDEDRATDLGTAFHRLAQSAVERWQVGQKLARPDDERVEALARTCALGPAHRARLSSALDRWFASDVAHEMALLHELAAEVPFFVRADDNSPRSEPAFLEGEIDLLGFDESHARAFVVDYKTGGREDETPQELREKHVLQASCYAYAIMSQGTQSVDAVFVRVERDDAENPGQPQCVRYHFEHDALPDLAQAILHVYDKHAAQ